MTKHSFPVRTSTSKSFSAKFAAEVVLRSIKYFNGLRDDDPEYSDETTNDYARRQMAGFLLTIHMIATNHNTVDYLISCGHPLAADEVTTFLALNNDRYARKLLTRLVSPAAPYANARLKAISDALVSLNPFAKSASWFMHNGRCGPARSSEIAFNQYRSRVRRRSPLWLKAESTRNNQGWAIAIDPDSGAYFHETAYYEHAQAAGDALYLYKAQAWAMWRYAGVLIDNGLDRCPFDNVTVEHLLDDNDQGLDATANKRWLTLAEEDFGGKASVILNPHTKLQTLQALSSARSRSPTGDIRPFRVLPFYPDRDHSLRVHVNHPLYRQFRRSGETRNYTTVGMMARILYDAHRRFNPAIPPLPELPPPPTARQGLTSLVSQEEAA